MKLFIVFAVIVGCVFAEDVLEPDVPLSENGLAALLAEHGGMVPMGEGRIVGGDPAPIAQWTFIVSMRRLGGHRCGGAIIRANRIATAAHCTVGMPATGLEFRAGSINHASGGQLRQSSSIINHPQYNAQTLNNDVSICNLQSGFDTGAATVNIIAIHAPGAGLTTGSNVAVAGWGATSEGGSGPAQLRHVTKPVVSNAQCNTWYGGGITAQMLCAGFAAGGRDACQGDSGGPLVQGNVLVGIVSWGRGCARPQLPGVYARSSSFNAFWNQ